MAYPYSIRQADCDRDITPAIAGADARRHGRNGRQPQSATAASAAAGGSGNTRVTATRRHSFALESAPGTRGGAKQGG